MTPLDLDAIRAVADDLDVIGCTVDEIAARDAIRDLLAEVERLERVIHYMERELKKESLWTKPA